MIDNDTITVTYDGLKKLIDISVKSFIENKKYYMSRRDSEIAFGETTMNLLLANKLLSDSKKIGSTKCRYIVSDIITAIEILRTRKAVNHD